MQIPPGKKVYFLSDFHLGAPDKEKSLEREKHIVSFLKEAQHDAAHIFIVGDIFDFWYEYKTVIPKGYTRLLGRLAEITDSGIPVSFFRWQSRYVDARLFSGGTEHPCTLSPAGIRVQWQAFLCWSR